MRARRRGNSRGSTPRIGMTRLHHESLSMRRTVPAIGFSLMCLQAPSPPAMAQSGNAERIADAKPGDVRVLATAAIRIPLEAVRAEASKLIGRPVVIEYGSARGNLKDVVLAGTSFEVAVLLPDVDEQLLKAKKI